MEKATLRKLAAGLLLAGTTAGCSNVSITSPSTWVPRFGKKPDQGLSWTTPDLSKTYGSNQIQAERGGSLAPRSEMPKPQPEGRVARMTEAVKQSQPIKAITGVFKRSPSSAALPSATGAAEQAAMDPKQAGLAVHLSVAHMQQQQGNLASAAQAYEQALRVDGSSLDALLGYARLQDRQGHFAQATTLYQTAARLHPGEAAAHNDLGLCLARQGRQAEAAAALERAVQIRPDRKLYRNNLAKLLIDVGQPERALAQLIAVHPPATAHYNLGFLLQQKEQLLPARQHFAKALELDPALQEARQWLATLDARTPPGIVPERAGPGQGPQVSYAPPVHRAAPATAALPQPRAVQPPPRIGLETGYFPPSRY